MDLNKLMEKTKLAKILVTEQEQRNIYAQFLAEHPLKSSVIYERLVGSAMYLYDRVMRRPEFDDKERKLAAMYLLVCADSVNEKLDVMAFENAAGIPSLRCKMLF